MRNLLDIVAHATICAAKGHDDKYHIDDDGLQLECMRCGRKTHGWWAFGSLAPKATK